MRIKMIVAAALAFASTALGLAVASPAQAGVNDCPVGSFCIWTDFNYSGTRYTYNRSSIDAGTNHGLRLGTLANNRGRSFFNRTTTSINIYDSASCGYYPWTRTMTSGQYATAQGSDWDRKVSAIQVEAYAPNC